MWLDTKVNGEIRLLNMEKQKQLRLERVSPSSCAWQLKLGSGTYGIVADVYENFEDALGMYEQICQSLNNGQHYFKVRENDDIATDTSGCAEP